jgi:alanine racemase
MARMGLEVDEFAARMQREPTMLEAARVGLILSHFACSPEANHPLNAAQLARFQSVCALAPAIPASLCNSGGVYLAPEYHFNLARPGCSLYGIAPQSNTANPMQHVATWHAPILATRTLEREQTVGYGATQTLPKGTRIATVASGYADGYLRHASGHAVGYIGTQKVPLVGRVTMDMLCFDVSHVPEALTHDGAMLTLLGDADGIRVDDVANAAETIGYEVLTRIGPRVKRLYV